VLTTTPIVPDVVELLDATARRMHAAASRPGLDTDVESRLRHLADDLSSHALAVRVLATSGASSETLDKLLSRVVDLLERDASESVHPRRNVS